MTRVMWDPIPDHPRTLTANELAACKRVLARLRTSICASVALTFDHDDQRTYAMLSRSGYVRSIRHQSNASFHWDRVEATEAGLEWLRQVST